MNLQGRADAEHAIGLIRSTTGKVRNYSHALDPAERSRPGSTRVTALSGPSGFAGFLGGRSGAFGRARFGCFFLVVLLNWPAVMRPHSPHKMTHAYTCFALFFWEESEFPECMSKGRYPFRWTWIITAPVASWRAAAEKLFAVVHPVALGHKAMIAQDPFLDFLIRHAGMDVSVDVEMRGSLGRGA